MCSVNRVQSGIEPEGPARADREACVRGDRRRIGQDERARGDRGAARIAVRVAENYRPPIVDQERLASPATPPEMVTWLPAAGLTTRLLVSKTGTLMAWLPAATVMVALFGPLLSCNVPPPVLLMA